MDLEGQVKIATSSPREWKRWGRYYCRSLASAHRNGTCHNFKDQSVQHYFGSFAKDLLADADAAYSKLPPPKPSRGGEGVASGAAMARAYHYRGNGCVAGDALARLFDGTCTSKRVSEVVKGDVLVDALTSRPATVRCVVRTRVLEPTLYSVGDANACVEIDSVSGAALSPRNDFMEYYRVHPTHWLFPHRSARRHGTLAKRRAAIGGAFPPKSQLQSTAT